MERSTGGVDVSGFDPVDAGTLDDSWHQQPGTPAYCTELTMSELTSALQSADRSRASENRDAIIHELMAAGGNLAHDEIVSRNRAGTV